MRFLPVPFLAAALALVPSAVAYDYYSLEGNGVLQVYSSDGKEFLGCITASAEWSEGGACGGISTHGDGVLRSDNGAISLDNGAIAITNEPFPTTWQATSYSNFGRPQFIVAEYGDRENGGGGPFWYASKAPTGSDSVALSASGSEGAQNVTLTWSRVL